MGLDQDELKKDSEHQAAEILCICLKTAEEANIQGTTSACACVKSFWVPGSQSLQLLLHPDSMDYFQEMQC